MTTSQNAHAYLAQYGELTAEERQVEATLAVAYEQRTANMIALYDMLESSTDALQKQAGVTVKDFESVALQIKERLGLE